MRCGTTLGRMKLIDSMMPPPPQRRGKRLEAVASVCLSVQMGCPGPDGESAVHALVHLGKRQKVGKRLGAAAVIKAERR